jgi:hypothetical protein
MPRPNSPIVSTRLMASLAPQFYPSRAEIQQQVVTRDTLGGELHTWETRPGHEAIPCAVGVRPTPGRNATFESRRSDATWLNADRLVQLDGYYPNIDSEDRCVVDEYVLDILGVEHDSHDVQTALLCEQIS